MRKKTLYICRAAVIAALYIALTALSSSLNVSSGPIQCRFAEALCILPYFTSAAIPGLSVGCLIGNLLTPGVHILDIIFGTLATLIGAVGTFFIGKLKLKGLAPIPPVVANTLIVPFILKYAYKLDGSVGIMMITVGFGEALTAGVLGMLLLLAVEPLKRYLFGIDDKKLQAAGNGKAGNNNVKNGNNNIKAANNNAKAVNGSANPPTVTGNSVKSGKSGKHRKRKK